MRVAAMLVCCAMVCLRSDATNQDVAGASTLSQVLQDAEAKRFSKIATLRFGAAISIDDTVDKVFSDSLAAEISTPLKALGVGLVRQSGQPIDTRLPGLFSTTLVNCAGRRDCDVTTRTSLSRTVQLPNDPSVEFTVGVWQKDHNATAADAGQARAVAREFVVNDMNEFVRHWAIANRAR